MNLWTETLDASGLAAHYAVTAKLDPRFAREEREFYETRSAAQLRALAAGAWNANNSTGYMLARSYLAMAEG